MMIEKLVLRDYRNYSEQALTPHPGINLFFGKNGSGKTNLLEAVHYCALGRSHRTSQDQETVRRGSEAAQVSVSVRQGESRHDLTVRLTPGEARKKQVLIDRKRAARLGDMMGRLRCVMFSPEDLMLIKGGPALRRRYIDMMLSQLSQEYFFALQQYQRAMTQRNTLLKNRADDHDPLFDVFEEQMTLPAMIIIRERKNVMDELSLMMRDCYEHVSRREDESFSVRYAFSFRGQEANEEIIRTQWQQSRRDDSMRGYTSMGPHRDDLRFYLNDHEMKLYASQGQMRTASLSLKLAQMRLFEERTGDTPVLLLDDVMSELDMTRRHFLLEELHGEQTWITCTDASDLQYFDQCRAYEVSLTESHEASVREIQRGKEIEQTYIQEEDLFN